MLLKSVCTKEATLVTTLSYNEWPSVWRPSALVGGRLEAVWRFRNCPTHNDRIICLRLQ